MGQQQSLSNRFRALLISPTYAGTSYYLDCTVNDAKGWYDFLVNDARVPSPCVRWLSDSNRFAPICRTAKTVDILDELAALVKWAHATKDPIIFLSYSGHGTQQRDQSGDEEDGKDEGWVPQDMGFVRDDFLHQEFLAKLPATCRVVAVNDACYNGTVWDACYTAQYVGKSAPLVKQKSRSLEETYGAQKAPIVGAAPIHYARYVGLRPLRLALLAIVFAVMLSKSYPYSLLALLYIFWRQGQAPPLGTSISPYSGVPETLNLRYSAGVNDAQKYEAGKNRAQPVCKFTALSSSNDRQVSYEGAKNGFFSYNLLLLVKKELSPLLAKAQSFEQLCALWPRTGHSIVQDLGELLNRQGIPQNPVWQTIANDSVGAQTPFLPA